MSFEEAFSDRAIVRELCRARIRLAQDRHQVLFLHNICSSEQGPHEVAPKNWGSIETNIFLPRRQWHRFRRKRRGTLASETINVEALERAVEHFRAKVPETPWVVALNATVDRIRRRVFSESEFQFQEPQIVLQIKDAAKRTYRALAVFTLEDKIIDCLTARYLRSTLDPALSPSCLAFRAFDPMPSIHSALDEITEARERWDDREIYVAECDIKGFFDCVAHSVAESSLAGLIEDAARVDPHLGIAPEAMRVFAAYLGTYSFRNVLESEDYGRIQDSTPPGQVKWHAADLKKLHSTDSLPRIGVPQGSALSCLVANAVLHSADQVLDALGAERDFLYLRYCDDMILISPSREDCEAAFKAYQESLRALLLPIHAPEWVRPYTTADSKKRFWERKSKQPFLWDAQADSNGVPWIQFVGYQVRRDGLVRVRQSSLQKERKKITKAADDLVAALKSADRKGKPIRRTPSEILHRLRQKMISMAVGRAKLGGPIDRTLPMCWTNGFRGLVSRKSVLNGIKALDRCREQQLKRVERALPRFRLPDPSPEKTQPKVHRYYGAPFSYCRRFLQ